MPKSEEQLQILKMIESGKISASEGARLLEALESATNRENDDRPPGKARWFRVRVTDLRTGKPKANVNIPIGLVHVGMRMGAKFAPDMDGIDLNEVIEAVKAGAMGKIMDVEDEEDGERVEIFVE